MNRKIVLAALTALATLPFTTGSAQADDTREHVVGQKNKQFSVKRLKVKVGDVVYFANDDPFFHNIFSLSSVATFDLGSFPQGERRSVTFVAPGIVHVECAIHPSMQMQVEVTE